MNNTNIFNGVPPQSVLDDCGVVEFRVNTHEELMSKEIGLKTGNLMKMMQASFAYKNRVFVDEYRIIKSRYCDETNRVVTKDELDAMIKRHCLFYIKSMLNE